MQQLRNVLTMQQGHRNAHPDSDLLEMTGRLQQRGTAGRFSTVRVMHLLSHVVIPHLLSRVVIMVHINSVRVMHLLNHAITMVHINNEAAMLRIRAVHDRRPLIVRGELVNRHLHNVQDMRPSVQAQRAVRGRSKDIPPRISDQEGVLAAIQEQRETAHKDSRGVLVVETDQGDARLLQRRKRMNVVRQ
jgi:hypothetical protein